MVGKTETQTAFQLEDNQPIQSWAGLLARTPLADSQNGGSVEAWCAMAGLDDFPELLTLLAAEQATSAQIREQVVRAFIRLKAVSLIPRMVELLKAETAENVLNALVDYFKAMGKSSIAALVRFAQNKENRARPLAMKYARQILSDLNVPEVY